MRILIDTPTTPPAAKQRIAQLVAKEHKLFASAFTEPGSSSLLIGLPFVPSVQARRVDGGYMLQGRKAFTSMGEASDYLMLMVHPQKSSNPLEMLMLLGPYPAPGLRVEHLMQPLTL